MAKTGYGANEKAACNPDTGAMKEDTAGLSADTATNLLTKVCKISLRHNQVPSLPNGPDETLDQWLQDSLDSIESDNILHEAALHLRNLDVPVAFPTETVYGLGADATRSSAVRGIFRVKGRPLDNPLIVHICSLRMLRSLLTSREAQPEDASALGLNSTELPLSEDVIPAIYLPLIKKFWPGPLTIILPLPPKPRLATEVTASLNTFGARMPNSAVALTLIGLSGVPLAAPSSNLSGKPSTTTAAHVYNDLKGKLNLILDGGDCAVGVESTVVDGLSHPPAVLRPGGVTIEQLRTFPGWEGVIKGYVDKSHTDPDMVPRAPGMKYTHYSPDAPLVLYEVGSAMPSTYELQALSQGGSVGVITNKTWSTHIAQSEKIKVLSLGTDAESMGRGLFAALRDLDSRPEISVIVVEGISDQSGVGSAVMNRLRKAASRVIGA